MRFPLTDHQGSVVSTADRTGYVMPFMNYSPWGELGSVDATQAYTAPPQGSPFGYTGREFDAETGLWQYRARYYQPRLGQFLPTDPIGMADDPNLYMYMGLDPVGRTDLTGQTCEVLGSRRTSRAICKLDDVGDLTRDEIRTSNRNYTAAVDRLIANGNRTAKIYVQGRTVSAREIVRILSSIRVTGDRWGGTGRASAPGANSDRTDPGGKRGGRSITIYGLAIRQDNHGGTSRIDADLQSTFVHEGIHQLDSEPEYISGSNHSGAYDAAAERLLAQPTWWERTFGQ